jgi:hypothetical protein
MDTNYNYVHISGAATVQKICPQPCCVRRIVIGTPIGAGTVTVLDGSNTVSVITVPATAANPITVELSCNVNSLIVTTTGSGIDVTVIYK